MPEIIVTGAAGFIGSFVATALLDRGQQVLGIDSLNAYYDPALKKARLQRLEGRNGFRFRQVDIADEAALKSGLEDVLPEAHHIIHLAAQAGVRYSIQQPEDYVRANLNGHFNMLQMARQAPKLEHLVYASSSSVYGASKKVPFALDDAADHPVSLYAATKRADELLSISYSRIFWLPQTGLRFFTVYGPWGRPDMAYYKFTKAILEGQPIETYAGGALQRDFTYIDDIVAGVLAALDRPPPVGGEEPHRLFNLGNDSPESVNALVTAIEAACGRKAQRIDQPMPLGDVPKTWADISASRQELGYSPTVKLEEGIRHFVAWYREYAKV
ncbi:SDR family NAD(P)-dependent oxidoreductase [Dongia deserti]|uniref:SDR family NAD(P)-dependent oxidoreductase n=1 Tax=Dongia deserti TaxID=2268030 RepID=UPI000E64FEE1|nr:SDR family NAD(P)-dependent oxidoreductase [Dongia deserti]